MLKHFMPLLFLLCTTAEIVAHANDSTLTWRKDGKFNTYCQVETKCSNKVANEMIDEFIGQFRGDPNLLFEWALKDLGAQNDSEKDEVLLILKKTTFDPQTGIGAILTDIKVPGIRTFKDINIESNVTKKTLPNGITEITVDIYYSNILLKKAFGVFQIIPQQNGNQLLTILIQIKFNWFFDLFITTKKYRSIVEWRAEGMMKNMRKEAELRETILKVPK